MRRQRGHSPPNSPGPPGKRSPWLHGPHGVETGGSKQPHVACAALNLGVPSWKSTRRQTPAAFCQTPSCSVAAKPASPVPRCPSSLQSARHRRRTAPQHGERANRVERGGKLRPPPSVGERGMPRPVIPGRPECLRRRQPEHRKLTFLCLGVLLPVSAARSAGPSAVAPTREARRRNLGHTPVLRADQREHRLHGRNPGNYG